MLPGHIDADKFTDYLTMGSMKTSALALRKISEWSNSSAAKEDKMAAVTNAAKAHLSSYTPAQEEKVCY